MNIETMNSGANSPMKKTAEFSIQDGIEVFSREETAAGEPMRQLMYLVENKPDIAAVVKKFFSDEVDLEIKKNDRQYASLISEVAKIVNKCLADDSKEGILADRLTVLFLKWKNRLN